jgi:hypothetical protein
MTTRRSSANSEQQWEALRNQSFSALRGFFEGEGADPQAVARAKIATSFISSYTRHEATASAREQTRLIIGRQLAENPEQFREFVRLALPGVPLPGPAALPEAGPEAPTSQVG